MSSKKAPVPQKSIEGRDRSRQSSKSAEGKETVFIPYSYLGEIQMNFVLTKAAVGFSLIALILSLITLLGK